MLLKKRTKYLQIAFNRDLGEVKKMISLLPVSEKIIIEAGTPFVKKYGLSGIRDIKYFWEQRLDQPGYIVADLKCMDRGSTEVEAAMEAGASAVTCLGLAPVETINEFIKKCAFLKIDSMVDMMNVEFPFEVLKNLKQLPDVVVLHRGADEGVLNREKMLPHHLIHRIKGTYNIDISLAGGEKIKDVTSAFFNDADIVVVWRSFYDQPEATAKLAQDFLAVIK